MNTKPNSDQSAKHETRIVIEQSTTLLPENYAWLVDAISRSMQIQRERYQALIEALVPTFEAMAAEMQRSQEAMVKAIRPAIEQFVESRRRLLESVSLDGETARTIFADAGFWLTPSMSFLLMAKIKHLETEGNLSSTTLKQVIVEHYSENNGAALRAMTRAWEKNPIYAPRMKIISDALEAHLADKYTLSIPVLLPQIEGIASQITGMQSGKSGTVVSAAIQEKYPELLYAATKEAVLFYVVNRVYCRVNFDEFPEWLEETGLTERDALHRHAILHGVQIDYASKENSLRAFLLLDVLAWLGPI